MKAIATAVPNIEGVLNILHQAFANSGAWRAASSDVAREPNFFLFLFISFFF
tara:strand:- start:346 stop:501 length:156 start_codon:yes stop_codon:yes gene_type:complete